MSGCKSVISWPARLVLHLSIVCLEVCQIGQECPHLVLQIQTVLCKLLRVDRNMLQKLGLDRHMISKRQSTACHAFWPEHEPSVMPHIMKAYSGLKGLIIIQFHSFCWPLDFYVSLHHHCFCLGICLADCFALKNMIRVRTLYWTPKLAFPPNCCKLLSS